MRTSCKATVPRWWEKGFEADMKRALPSADPIGRDTTINFDSLRRISI